MVFIMPGIPQRDSGGGVGPCLYGFTLDYTSKEAVLVHILYSHKKMNF